MASRLRSKSDPASRPDISNISIPEIPVFRPRKRAKYYPFRPVKFTKDPGKKTDKPTIFQIRNTTYKIARRLFLEHNIPVKSISFPPVRQVRIDGMDRPIPKVVITAVREVSDKNWKAAIKDIYYILLRHGLPIIELPPQETPSNELIENYSNAESREIDTCEVHLACSAEFGISDYISQLY